MVAAWIAAAGLGLALIATAALYNLRSRSGKAADLQRPALFICSTFHCRFFPVKHSFRYPVFYIGIDLDAEGTVTSLFSFAAARRLLRVDSADYLGKRYPGTLKEKLWRHIAAAGIPTADLRRAYLVTTPRFLGYSFNPASFHFVYDGEDKLRVVVLEVNNTFGEKHIYVLDQAANDAAALRDGYHGAQKFVRNFHVSPFNDRSGHYRVQCRDPFAAADWQKVAVHLTLLDDAGDKKMIAYVNSARPAIGIDDVTGVLLSLAAHGWTIFMTMPWILFEAFKLHYGKKLPAFVRPEPFEGAASVGWQEASATDTYFASRFLEHVAATGACVRVRLACSPLESPEMCFGGARPASDCATPIDTRAEEALAGEEREPLEIIVFSYGFFTSLAIAASPLACLLTDSLCHPSPSFTVSDANAFLALFEQEAEPAGGLLKRLRSLRLPPSTFYTTADATSTETDTAAASASATTDSIEMAIAPVSIRGLDHGVSMYKLASAALLTYGGELVFDRVATFAGEAGSPARSWERVARAVQDPRTDGHRWAARKLGLAQQKAEVST